MTKAIYLIEIISNIDLVANGIVVVFLSLVAFYVSACYVDDNETLGKLSQLFKKTKKLTIPLVIISSLVVLFVPHKETMYAMLVTEKVLTEKNYNITVNEAKKIIDYTVNKIEKTKEK